MSPTALRVPEVSQLGYPRPGIPVPKTLAPGAAGGIAPCGPRASSASPGAIAEWYANEALSLIGKRLIYPQRKKQLYPPREG